MKRFIEGHDRGQSTLFPEGLEDLVDGNNPVRVMPTLSLQTFGHLPQPAQPFIASLFSPKTAPAPSCQAVAGDDTVKNRCPRTSAETAIMVIRPPRRYFFIR